MQDGGIVGKSPDIVTFIQRTVKIDRADYSAVDRDRYLIFSLVLAQCNFVSYAINIDFGVGFGNTVL